jgi:hypothetical protein
LLRLVRQRWAEQGVQNAAAVELALRQALFHDAARLLEALYNQAELPPELRRRRPGEKRHPARPKQILTLFGWITLRRDYFYEPAARRGRAPLDEALGLQESFSPAVVRLADRAAAREGYEASAADLKELAGLELEGRQIQRLVGASAPALLNRAALAWEGKRKRLLLLAG